MFWNKKKTTLNHIKYDPQTMRPVIRCSICTGEQVAGFKDRATGQFTEYGLIRDQEDLEEFKRTFGLTNVEKEY